MLPEHYPKHLQLSPEQINHSPFTRAKTIALLKEAIAATKNSGPGQWEVDEKSRFLSLRYRVEGEANINRLGDNDPYVLFGGESILLAAGIKLQDTRAFATGEGEDALLTSSASILTAAEA